MVRHRCARCVAFCLTAAAAYFIAAFAAALVLVQPAAAQKRVALIVGNSAYTHAGALANPANDAADMAAALKEVGIEVILGLDLDKRAFDMKVRDFARALTAADTGIFFYAGHGLQVAGRNYLVPVDAQLQNERDLDFEAVALDFVLKQMELERETKTNIVFLDACRDNPLGRNLARNMGTRSASVGRGLAQVQTGVGTFIAYSTQPGNVALDGSGRNSPFTAALAKGVKAPGRNLTAVMIDVRKEVLSVTNGKQVPWDHSALTGDFYFHLASAPGSLPKTGACAAGGGERGSAAAAAAGRGGAETEIRSPAHRQAGRSRAVQGAHPPDRGRQPRRSAAHLRDLSQISGKRSRLARLRQPGGGRYPVADGPPQRGPQETQRADRQARGGGGPGAEGGQIALQHVPEPAPVIPAVAVAHQHDRAEPGSDVTVRLRQVPDSLSCASASGMTGCLLLLCVQRREGAVLGGKASRSAARSSSGRRTWPRRP